MNLFIPLFICSFSLVLNASDIEQRILFHHIPKTGGTTLIFLLQKNFSSKQVCPKHFSYQIAKHSHKYLCSYQFIRGHFPYSQLQKIPGIRFTFLREPIEQILSAHRFWKKHYEKTRPHQLSREFILRKGDPLLVMENHQCLFLSSFSSNDPSIPLEKHVQSAKENLATKFDFVGITEKMDESIKKLYTLLNFPLPPITPQLNTTKKEVYSEELLAQLRVRNWADIELYEFAKKLFEQNTITRSQ